MSKIDQQHKFLTDINLIHNAFLTIKKTWKKKKMHYKFVFPNEV